MQTQLPKAAAEAVDWAALKRLPGTFVDTQFLGSQTDLLFSAPLDDREGLIYMLFEHQSSPDADMPLRLLRYLTRIWEHYRRQHGPVARLPVIIPIVLSQNARVWKVAEKLSELMAIPKGAEETWRPFIPDFEFRHVQLARLGYDELPGTPAGRLVLRVMKAERLAELLADVVWEQALWRELSEELLAMVVRYLLAAEIDSDAFLSRLEKLGDTQTQQTAMTLAQQFRQEGRQEGELALTSRLLKRKFPGIAPEVEPRLVQLTEEALLAFGEALLFMTNEQECLNWFSDRH